jgi:FtsH-binding integral membrane protein
MDHLLKYLKPTIYWALVSAATVFVMVILLGFPNGINITISISRLFFGLLGTQFILTIILIFLNR